MAGFNDLMNGFGIVTVMNVKLFKLKPTITYTNNAFIKAADYENAAADVGYLDTLKIANLNIEGPNKTVTGGQYNNPLIKWGKTGTIEMQDALGSATIFEWFYGAEVVKNGADITNIGIGGKFAGPFAIQGETFYIDQQTGDEVPVYIYSSVPPRQCI